MKKVLKSFHYAFVGMRLAWQEGINFRIELFCAVAAAALAWYLHLPAVEYAIVLFVISSVLAAEAFNTALEELCDKFQPTHDPHIAKIKDLSAAAVLVLGVGAAIVGGIIFVPHLLALYGF